MAEVDPYVPYEAIILESLSVLHQLIYDMITAIGGIEGLVVLGFDSSHTNNPLPKKGIKISVLEVTVDRLRPTPQASNRVEELSGTEIIREYEDHGVRTGYSERTLRYPLPVSVIYDVHTWCYDTMTQLAINQAIMQTIPERGTLTFAIDGENYLFPVELLNVVPLDDLDRNLRETVFRFRVEAYISSHLSDDTRKIITTIEEDTYLGSKEEDVNSVLNYNPLDTILDEPE